jgi:hypothetical protein
MSARMIFAGAPAWSLRSGPHRIGFSDGKQFRPRAYAVEEAGEQASLMWTHRTTLIILTFDHDAAKSYGGSTEVLTRMEKS